MFWQNERKFIHSHDSCVLAVSGIGTGVGAALFADIARATAKEKRTGVMSIIMATRQLGLVLGQFHFTAGHSCYGQA